ncbi:glycosyl hydrolase family 65 protein [Nocardiopsis alba]|uniref:glycoside hydrolase family 65 protein n=1 Tax=Nocardiopsis alba TaxID=53437 RepID=UPI0033D83963
MNRRTLVYEATDPTPIGVRETLCTLGNGYFATRGAPPEARADGVHYPGTYVAGCYDRLASLVEGHRVENEDLVNVPDWTPLTFRHEDGHWFEAPAPDPPERVELDMGDGVLTRTFRVVDEGRRTRVTQRRLVSMDDPHLAVLETALTPENWSGTVIVRSALDGGVANAGVPRYRDLNGRHLRPAGVGADTSGVAWLRSRTLTSGVEIVLASRTRVASGPGPSSVRSPMREDHVATDLTLELGRGERSVVEKTVALYTSRDRAIGDALGAARDALDACGGLDGLLSRHTRAWHRLWDACAVRVADEEEQRLLDLCLFHLLQTLSPHTADLDVGVPARGLHGEAYRGHVFWDELFVLPFLDARLPEVSRGLLRYRWRRLPRARSAARAAGLRGALFPWQSASDGREESQSTHLNPRSGEWLPDHSHLQRHVGLAIAHNVWRHYRTTRDLAFLCDFGAELLLEIARAFSDMAVHDRASDRYGIHGVMGPDEYHDAYPGEDSPGLDDNAYTNVMTAWVLARALDVLRALPGPRRRGLQEAIGLGSDEIERFETVSRKLRVPFHEGVISQFSGYERLAELDWETRRGARRLDRILQAEGDSVNRYKAAKQADVLMLFFLLSPEEVADVLRRLGLTVDPDLVPRTVEYYLARTAHGSTLSAVVHARVLARIDRKASWEFFREALKADAEDVQGGTTAEGIHLGAMAGALDLLTRCYGGLSTYDDVLSLDPVVPEEQSAFSYDLRLPGHWKVCVEVTHDHVRVTLPHAEGAALRVRIQGSEIEVPPGSSRTLPLHDPPPDRT